MSAPFEMPHPDAKAAAFRFARLLADPEFRAHLASYGEGLTVFATCDSDDPAVLAARVREYSPALVVALDESQPWGLRITRGAAP